MIKDLSMSKGSKMRVGYLGPKGTFTEVAFQAYCERNGIDAEGIPCCSFIETFQKMEAGACDEIVMPIENSIEGEVNVNLDLLVRHPELTIIEEIVIPITHALMAKEAKSVSEVTNVVSHHQPIAQCEQYLMATLPGARSHIVASTARAAQIVAKDPSPLAEGDDCEIQSKVFAAIGNRRLAAIYGLTILDDNIQDSENNRTRFVVVSRKEAEPTGDDKTSIVFSSHKDEPGCLYAILGAFAERKINLTKIASRPTKDFLGEYLFFIDFEGHSKDEKVKEALEFIQTKAGYYRLLGSYKKNKI
jgi:prephenate dehydratase